MSTANELGREYLKSELRKANSRLEVYCSLYNIGKIKCITLKRLINVKEEEIKHLKFLYDELPEIKD